MKIFDISQGVFGSAVYPGDPAPQKQIISSMEKGDLYNLTAFSMCAHNGTHIDAPSHFVKNGRSVSEIPLEKFVGSCLVAEHEGVFTQKDALTVLEKAKNACPDAAKRILLKGKCVVSQEAATVFAQEGIFLLGVEPQTVGPEDSPMEVHKILLNNETVLLEGIRLSDVPTGVYFLSAAPLKLEGSDGAPARAILIDIK